MSFDFDKNNEDIICQNNHILKFIEKNTTYYLNRTTLIFGRTNSGKSTILNEILYICKNKIPVVWVISKTNELNDNFSNMIPKLFIKKDLDNDFLFSLLERQRCLSSIYNMVNNKENLYSLFMKVASEDEINKYNKISIKEKHMINVMKQNSDFVDYKSKIGELKKISNNFKIKFLKDVINKKKNDIDVKNLNKEEKNILHYLFLNPNILIVLDDCASSFKLWYKKCKKDNRSCEYGDPIKSLFYEGRWMNVTLIITAQDDKEIDPELRKNSLVTIFTTEESVISNFNRMSNSYPSYIKKQAEIFSRAVFYDRDKKNYKKLVYLKIHGECPFRYTIASIYDDFKIGSNIFWEFSEKILNSRKNKPNKYLID